MMICRNTTGWGLIRCIVMLDQQDAESTTPILDSGVLPPVRHQKRAVGVIIGVGIGFLFGAVIDNVGSLARVVVLQEFGH